MSIHGYSWVYIGIQGFTWVFIGIQAYTGVYMGIQGFTWVFIGIECFQSRDYRPYCFTETKGSICIKIEFNSQRFSLGHQHGRHFFVLGHQHGRRDVM